MKRLIKEILSEKELSKHHLIELLSVTEENERQLIFKKAAQIRDKYCGKYIYLRGLIEYSNICSKNCNYCGIRASNKQISRYCITPQELEKAVEFARINDFSSIVIQSGERSNKEFVDNIERDVINIISKGDLNITLSCGEQSFETYSKWRSAGVKRYLLRIETTNRVLFKKLHPLDFNHDFDNRLNALKNIKKAGFQTGTGVMIGLPFQTEADLADDLIFFRDLDIDMVGMGPYVEHWDTPLYKFHKQLLPAQKRFDISLLMIAVLRILMKDINIAAATALDALNPNGRVEAIKVGANVFMPNITPFHYRSEYFLYSGKPCKNEIGIDLLSSINQIAEETGYKIGFGMDGDSKHIINKDLGNS